MTDDPQQDTNLAPCCAVCSNPVSLGAGICVICGCATEIVLKPRPPIPR